MANSFAKIVKSPEIVSLRTGKDPLPAEFQAGRNVLLVHGFGSHCANLEVIAARFINWGYDVFGYNYRSSSSIDSSSRALGDLLSGIVPLRSFGDRAKVHAVGHSMGGLVLREFSHSGEANKYLKSLTMLGSPNNSTLSTQLMKRLVQHVEHVSYVLDPSLSESARGPAARQLIRADNEGRECFLDALNRREVGRTLSFPFLSIAAGGGPSLGLRISKRSLRQRYVNHRIQRMLNDPRNDGLVAEKSVDMRQFMPNAPAPYSHYNDAQYVDFLELDHSGLVESQAVAVKIKEFFENVDGAA